MSTVPEWAITRKRIWYTCLAAHETTERTGPLAEMDYLEENYRAHSLAYIAEHLGRTVKAITGMAVQLRCTEKNIQHWSNTEKTVLLHHYDSPTSLQTIFSLLPGRSPTAIMAMARKMGLSRPCKSPGKTNHSLLELFRHTDYVP